MRAVIKILKKFKQTWAGIFLLVFMAVLYSCDTTEKVTPAQGKVFIKLYGGRGSEEGRDLALLPDGGFVLVGSTTSNSNGGKDVYIVRTDEIGNMIWERNYGGSSDDIGNSVILGSNNTLYVCGESTFEGLAPIKNRDVFVLNINLDDGSLIGDEKKYGAVFRDEAGEDIIELENGDFFITSTMYHEDTSKYFLIETDGQLNMLPNRGRYIGTEKTNNYSAKSFDNSGDVNNPFICYGSVYRTVNGEKSFWFRSFLYRSNSDATVSPEYYGTQNNNQICTDAFHTMDGGYILSGYTDELGLNNEMLVKVNRNQKEEWRMVYPNEFNRDIVGAKVVQTLDGGFIVSSTIEMDDPKKDEISILKINAVGEEEWRKTFGSDDDDKAASILQLEDGSYVVVGTIGFDINTESLSKMCLLKINPEGDLVPL